MVKKLVLLCSFVWLCLVGYAQNLEELIDNCKKIIVEKQFAQVIEESQILLNRSDLDSSQIALVSTFAGVASKEIGKHQDALNYFKKSIDYKISQFDIYEMFISIASDLGDNENYEFGLKKEVITFPFQKEVNDAKLINLYVKSKQYEKLASFSYELIDSGSTDKSNLYYYAAYANQSLNNIADAEKDYLESLNADPENMKSNLGLGMYYYKKAGNVYKSLKAEYNNLKNPSRLDYDHYRKSLESSKSIYRKSLGYIMKVYNENPSDNLKVVIYNTYIRLGEKTKAEVYK